MNLVHFIAFKYLKGSGKNSATFLTTLISVIGVMLSVTAIFSTLSIINGFQSEIKQKIIDFHPNIVIYSDMNENDYKKVSKTLMTIKEIEFFTPFIITQAILITPTRTSGCIIKAVSADDEKKITNISKALRYGKWHSKGEIVIGEELAKLLGLWIGDWVVAVIPQSDYLGGIIPKMKKFKISGIINTGYFEYDSSSVIADISDGKSFISNGTAVNGIEIKIKDITKAEHIKKMIKEKIPFYMTIKTYAEINKNLFSALKLEKFVMSFILSLIILISTFAITSNLFIMTVVKKREIGIMRAIGISSSQIKKIFIYSALFISAVGIVIGFILSSIILFIIKNYNIIELPQDIYYITKVPVKVEIMDILLVSILTLGLTIISAWYPAKKASEIDPVDAIRYG